MKPKYIVIIAVTALLTIVLMNNTEPVKFWIFGDVWLSKLAVMAVLFVLGTLFGLFIGRRKKEVQADFEDEEEDAPISRRESTLSDDDRDYIS